MPQARKHGTFHWNELMTHDAAAARKFYAESLGWTYDGMPMPDGGTYWLAKSGDEMAGGLFEMKGPEFANVPENWMAYIAVDDVDTRLKKAVAAGAQIIKPAFDVPGVGRIAILKQPGGGTIGWMTPA